MLQQTVVWAIVCLALLGLSVWRPELGRRVMGGFFIVMAVAVNVALAFLAPEMFVKLGTDAPLIPFYRWVFEQIVSLAPAVVGLLVATFEITLGTLMLKGGRWANWGLIGGIAFVLLITPLGPWTLPNVIVAAAMFYILRRRQAQPADAAQQVASS